MRILVQTLGNDDRRAILEANVSKFRHIEKFNAVNGYDKAATKKALVEANIPLLALAPTTYGVLANWLTKLLMLEKQIADGTAYMLMLEDDVLLADGFIQLVEALVKDGKVFDKYNIVRLGPWGEGYVTSLKSAKRCVNLLRAAGIRAAIDNQLRELCGPEIWFRVPVPLYWRLVYPSNTGDILKTEKLESNFNEVVASEYQEYSQFLCHFDNDSKPIKDINLDIENQDQWHADFDALVKNLHRGEVPRMRDCIDLSPDKRLILNSYDHVKLYSRGSSIKRIQFDRFASRERPGPHMFRL